MFFLTAILFCCGSLFGVNEKLKNIDLFEKRKKLIEMSRRSQDVSNIDVVLASQILQDYSSKDPQGFSDLQLTQEDVSKFLNSLLSSLSMQTGEGKKSNKKFIEFWETLLKN